MRLSNIGRDTKSGEMGMNDYYLELLKQEAIWLQKISNEFHTKRLKCESIQEVEQAHSKDYNHRKIGISEVIWDIDCHEPALSHQIWQRISTNLDKDKINHSVWNTSRSYHIHALFDGLSKYCQEDRKQIKLLILKEYAKDDMGWVDKSKANENVMIRDFWSVHEITGKQKISVWGSLKAESILNPLKASILNDFSQKVVNPYLAPNRLNSHNIYIWNNALEPKLAEALTRFLTFAQNTPFPKSGMGKNNLYFKNIAIAVFRLGIAEKEAKQIFKNVALQCRPHKAEKMVEWLKWCKDQKHEIKVNWGEVRGFYDK